MLNNVETVTAGLDWITLTLPIEKITGEMWVEHCLKVLDKISEGGYELKYRTIQGYYGVSTGNCFVGTRDDSHMVQLTGIHANDHFVEVYRPDVHVSRLDVQATVKYKEMPNELAREAYRQADASNLRLPKPRRRKLLLISGSDGGDTVYIGSPSSEQRARIYNKEVQSEDILYTKSWRFEVVYKNNLSTTIARSVPYNARERALWATRVVYTWLKARGVDDCGLGALEEMPLPLSRTMPTDVEKRLLWLQKQVVPTIKKLIDAGFASQVRELLDGSGIFRQD